jgi:hypothetical protein
MAKKTGTMRRIATKTVAAGRSHLAKVLTGDETIPEAAGGTVEDLLSGSKTKASANPVEKKDRGKQTPVAKKKATRKEAAGKIERSAKKRAATPTKKS